MAWHGMAGATNARCVTTSARPGPLSQHCGFESQLPHPGIAALRATGGQCGFGVEPCCFHCWPRGQAQACRVAPFTSVWFKKNRAEGLCESKHFRRCRFPARRRGMPYCIVHDSDTKWDAAACQCCSTQVVAGHSLGRHRIEGGGIVHTTRWTWSRNKKQAILIARSTARLCPASVRMPCLSHASVRTSQPLPFPAAELYNSKRRLLYYASSRSNAPPQRPTQPCDNTTHCNV